jgi:hypothetical protein
MTKFQFDQTQIFLLGTAWAFLWGAIGMFIGYYLNIRRDFRMQKAELREFLGRWEQEIYRVREHDATGTYAAYLKREGDFNGFVHKLAPEFWRIGKFFKLCAPLRARLPEHFETGETDCRQVVATPINNLSVWL